jgi:PleD family two-component response regulator
VSQSIAIFPRHAQEAFVLIDKADKLLYIAKNRGRDQVVMYEA